MAMAKKKGRRSSQLPPITFGIDVSVRGLFRVFNLSCSDSSIGQRSSCHCCIP